MDTIEDELFYNELERYGYNLLRSKASNPSAVLLKMLTSKDGRILEGVPVVLTNMLLNGQLSSLAKIEEEMPQPLQRRFRMLAAITLCFVFLVPESIAIRKVLNHYLENSEPSILGQVQLALSENQRINIGGIALDTERLSNTYKNYVVNHLMSTRDNLSHKLDEQRQAALIQSLSVLFTERQRELLFKLLSNQDLNKTEKEYFSRTVKPRLKALRNTDLQSLAATLTGT
jgi:hypothetical protein